MNYDSGHIFICIATQTAKHQRGDKQTRFLFEASNVFLTGTLETFLLSFV